MLYVFERNADVIRCELRPVSRSNDFEIAIVHPGQAERVETYTDLHAANLRLLDLKRQLQHDGWRTLPLH